MLRNSTLLSIALLLAWPLASFAQGTGADEVTRQVLRGNVGPYYGASYYERYHYGNIQPLNITWDRKFFYDAEYQDRLDRQAMFGHRWPSAKYGSDFQVNRINQEYLQKTEQIEKPSRFSIGFGSFWGRVR